ncbi:MAG: hypothetical protein M5U12_31755 [Verrucomicrobia bacterium]|nr:hypothetical protein [Verrucomicrobiota bacterium]
MVTTLSAGALRYSVATDFTSVWQVLLTGSVVNEFTGRGVDFELRTDPTSLFVRVVSDGGFAIAGCPELDFPPTPGPSILVQLDFQASGYRPARQLVPLPSAGPWPVPWPPVLLRPLPGVLQGRITQDVTPSVPSQAPACLPRTRRSVRFFCEPPCSPMPPPARPCAKSS